MGRMLPRLATFAAAAAAISLAASPVAAKDRWHGHRGGGIDAGDVLAGVLIIGGIAAIAGAASKSNRDRDYREDSRYPEPYRGSYPQERYEDRGNYGDPGRSYNGGGIDNAVNMCTDQVERGRERVASVDNASRTGQGWQISGQLEQGGGFSCEIDNDGRIRDIDIGDGYSGSYDEGLDYRSSDQGAGGGDQWNDDDYARARAQARPSGDYGEADQNFPG